MKLQRSGLIPRMSRVFSIVFLRSFDSGIACEN